MTVESDVQYATYDTDGVTLNYPIPFYFLDAEHIFAELISAGEVISSLNNGVDYTISGAGDSEGGTLMFSSAPATGFKLHIFRNVPVTQETGYQQNSAFPAKTTETALDKLTMIAQQNSSAVANSIRYPRSEFDNDGTLPVAADRAKNLLGFDANGYQTLMPVPASVGAGDIRWEFGSDGTRGFKAGVDFIPNVTTQLTLSRSPINDANVWAYWDGAEQLDAFITDDNKLNFPTPIPSGIGVVNVRVGTTLSLNLPAQKSVGDDELTWGSVLARQVSSVAALRALPSAAYLLADVASFYGDGRGSRRSYWRDMTDTTSAEDLPFVIVASDGTRWKLLDSFPVDSLAFGARPDNTTDSSDALHQLFSRGKRGYTIPGGQYKFSTGVVSNYNTSPVLFPIPGAPSARGDVRGESMANTILAFNGTGFGINLIGSDNAGSGQGLLSLDSYGGFTLQDSLLSKRNSGVFMRNKAWFKLHDIFVQYMDTALQLDSCFTGKLLNLFLTYSNYGCTLSTNTLGAANALDFDRCTFSHNSKAGVFGSSVGSAVNFRTCTIESCGTQGDYTTGGMLLNYGAYGYSGPGTIDGCYFEHNSGVADIAIDNTIADPLTVIIRGAIFVRSDGVFFTRNNISVTSSGGGPVTIILEGCKFISANSYVPDPSKAFWVGDSHVTFVDGGGNSWNETTSIVTPLLCQTPRAQALISGGTSQAQQRCVVVRNGAGDYSMNFNEPLVFGTYFFNVTPDAAGQSSTGVEVLVKNTSQFRFKVKNQSGTPYDPTWLSAQIWGM